MYNTIQHRLHIYAKSTIYKYTYMYMEGIPKSNEELLFSIHINTSHTVSHIFTCIHIFTYILITYTYIHIHILYTYIHTYTHTHIYIHTYTYMNTYIHTYRTYIYTHHAYTRSRAKATSIPFLEGKL